jgi:hypothetical protein
MALSRSCEDRVIDLSTSLDVTPWIGWGKKWPVDPPGELIGALMDKLTVPQGAFSPRFPISPNIDVIKFVEMDLPTSTADFITVDEKLWFSCDEPITNVRVALDRPIPSRTVVETLLQQQHVGQFWLDGNQSFVDLRFNNGKDRFPIWILTFFQLIHDTRGLQDRWRNSITFLNKFLGPATEPGVRAAAKKAFGMLGDIGWNEKLLPSGESSSELATFLSSSWLASCHIELQVLYLQERLRKEPVHGRRIGIAPLAFTDRLVKPAIQKFFDSEDPLSDRTMRNVEAEVITGKLDELYMPAHLSTQHWIVLAADFKSGTVRFGM